MTTSPSWIPSRQPRQVSQQSVDRKVKQIGERPWLVVKCAGSTLLAVTWWRCQARDLAETMSNRTTNEISLAMSRRYFKRLRTMARVMGLGKVYDGND